jgi:hypothetical protein
MVTAAAWIDFSLINHLNQKVSICDIYCSVKLVRGRAIGWGTATSRKTEGSIPDGVFRDFSLEWSFRRHYEPGVFSD